MKAYVIPVETLCNGKCNFCITKFREHCGEEFLKIENLDKALEKVNVDSIEITGGGDPLLNPKINDIINSCVKKTKTQIYTNGFHVNKIENPEYLEFLCLSRAHHDDYRNKEIMGVDYDIARVFQLKVPIKLSLLLHKSGIYEMQDLREYLRWARNLGASKVVVRQLFEHDYSGELDKEYISTKEISKYFSGEEKGDSKYCSFMGMPLEFELRACSCEMDNPVIHADGLIYKGWSNEVLE